VETAQGVPQLDFVNSAFAAAPPERKTKSEHLHVVSEYCFCQVP
jgi:hypothetical protein